MRRLDRLMPPPTLMVAALVLARSQAPILTGLCIFLYVVLNVGISHVAIRSRKVHQSGVARFMASAGTILLVGWFSGPGTSAWFLGILAVFAAVFATSGLRQVLFVTGFSTATLLGAKLGGETWYELVPIAVKMGCVSWLSAGLSRALYSTWARERRTSTDLNEKNLRLEQALSAKKRFLATMSHEVRTPLNGVLGMAEVLETTTLDHEQRSMVETIQSSGQGLLQVLNDVLDTAKLEAGKLTLQPVAFEPGKLVGSVVELMRAGTHGIPVQLDFELDPKLPQALVGDPVRIRQVLLNLVGNALKFTTVGHVIVRARWSQELLYIQVEDTGIGISPQAQALVFEPFAQATEESGQYFSGTGLGLSICKQLTALMQGELSLRSELGKGSCFSLTLPAPLGALNPAQVSAAPIPLSGQVLLVDDNEVNLLVAQHMLIAQGCTPTLARNGEEAVVLARKQTFDLVLMDCQMPVMDGFSATRKLRSMGLELPIVALTASVTEAARQACIQAGMNDLLAKPVSMEQLNRTLAKWMPSQETSQIQEAP
ncbi:MAG: signal transduction histidine kinase/ActR/RegA family two-component response regulator [Cognaticolwellia sp.]|jgi:signal transduction histidine kinase/ActR/RegA family two-component response regulator